MVNVVTTRKGAVVQEPSVVTTLLNHPLAAWLWLPIRVWLGWQWLRRRLGKGNQPGLDAVRRRPEGLPGGRRCRRHCQAATDHSLHLVRELPESAHRQRIVCLDGQAGQRRRIAGRHCADPGHVHRLCGLLRRLHELQLPDGRRSERQPHVPGHCQLPCCWPGRSPATSAWITSWCPVSERCGATGWPSRRSGGFPKSLSPPILLSITKGTLVESLTSVLL